MEKFYVLKTLLSERSQSEEATYRIIPAIWYSEKDKLLKNGHCQGVKGKPARVGRAKRIFRAVKLFCMKLQWGIHVFINLSKAIKGTTSRANPSGNYGLWVIMMCQYRFIFGNKCTILVRNVNSDWVGGLGKRGTGRSYKAILLYFPLNFYMNIKLFHKNKIHYYKK